MSKINVEDILKKKCGKHRFDSMEKEDIVAAIKKIVELVVDKCAENAETTRRSPLSRVHRDSILKVKEEVDYDS